MLIMQRMQDLLEGHLQLLNNKLEESRKLMKDNILLHEQLQREQSENQRLRSELDALQAKEVVDRRASDLSAIQGNQQTKAWVDRLVQEIDACLESLNR
jgi:regulatory protein YycI of two-component signal transduction system YycFG